MSTKTYFHDVDRDDFALVMCVAINHKLPVIVCCKVFWIPFASKVFFNQFSRFLFNLNVQLIIISLSIDNAY